MLFAAEVGKQGSQKETVKLTLGDSLIELNCRFILDLRIYILADFSFGRGGNYCLESGAIGHHTKCERGSC